VVWRQRKIGPDIKRERERKKEKEREREREREREIKEPDTLAAQKKTRSKNEQQQHN
jgi:hypothetical protein